VPAAESFLRRLASSSRLPAEKIRAKLPELIAGDRPSQRGVLAFAHAIMTTDTRPKQRPRASGFVVRELDSRLERSHRFGNAKGAA